MLDTAFPAPDLLLVPGAPWKAGIGLGSVRRDRRVAESMSIWPIEPRRVVVGAVGVPGYMVDHRGGFFAVVRTSGREPWRYPIAAMQDRVAAYGFAASPAVGGGRVFAATLDGEVMAFDIEG